MTEKVLVGNPSQLELDGQIDEDKLVYLVMDLPFGCNYECPKCYRSEDVSIEDLDLDRRKEIISQAKDLGARVVGIPGEGEPLFHKGVVRELVEHNSSLLLTTIIYTNGSLLDGETAQFLFDHDVTLIGSVDSFNPEVYRRLTGKGNIAKVRGNLDRARDIYRRGIRKRGEVIKTRIGLITIVSQQNRDEIGEIKEWCGDEVYFICNFPIKHGSAVQNWDSLVGDDLQGLADISHRYTETGYAGLSTPLKDGRCAALYNGITVDTNGKVLVCPASVSTSVGNIRDDNLESLWGKIREYVKEKGNPLCMAREEGEKVFRIHDGNIVQHL